MAVRANSGKIGPYPFSPVRRTVHHRHREPPLGGVAIHRAGGMDRFVASAPRDDGVESGQKPPYRPWNRGGRFSMNAVRPSR